MSSTEATTDSSRTDVAGTEASGTKAGRLTAFSRWIDDRLNPVVVKELRQGVQSRAVTSITNLLLCVLVFIAVTGAMYSSASTSSDSGGRDIFMFIQGALFIATIGLIPLYSIVRIWMERNTSNLDLMFITTLTPAKIVRGKFFAAMSLATLLFSICLPFMLFTYMLRGFDIPSMLISLAWGYLTAAAAIMAAQVIVIWASSNRYLGPLAILGVIIGLFIVVPYTITIASLTLYEGASFMFNSWETISVLCFSLLVFLLLMKVTESIGIGALSPASSDRTFRIRIWSTVTVIVTGVCAVISAIIYADADPMLIWAMCVSQLVLFVLIIAICERDDYSNRILLRRPKFMPARPLTFFFTGGASGGIGWAMLHLLPILLIAGIAIKIETSTGGSHHLEEVVWALAIWSAYVVGYAMAGRLLLRILMPRIPSTFGWLTTLLVFAFCMIGSIFVCYMLDPMHWERNDFWKYFNPVMALDDYEIRSSMLPIIAAMLMLLINFPWEARGFFRYIQKSAIAYPVPIVAESVASEFGSTVPVSDNPFVQ